MTTVLKPSTLIPNGLQVQQVNNLTLFKFTEALGDRLQTLLDKKKDDTLTAEEASELDAIDELDENFSYINAVMTFTNAQFSSERNWVSMCHPSAPPMSVNTKKPCFWASRDRHRQPRQEKPGF